MINDLSESVENLVGKGENADNQSLPQQGNKPFENTVGKGEIARNEQFLLFPQCFPPVWITFCHFCQI